jgi:hypothetical protein
VRCHACLVLQQQQNSETRSDMLSGPFAWRPCHVTVVPIQSDLRVSRVSQAFRLSDRSDLEALGGYSTIMCICTVDNVILLNPNLRGRYTFGAQDNLENDSD